MKKKIALVLATMMLTIGTLTGCNKQVVDLTYKFDKAMIAMPGGEVVEGKIQSWMDYENSDQIQVKIDGKTYLVHSANVVLIAG